MSSPRALALLVTWSPGSLAASSLGEDPRKSEWLFFFFLYLQGPVAEVADDPDFSRMENSSLKL